MVSETKVMNDFSKFLSSINESTKDQTKTSKELIRLARQQLFELKNIAEKSALYIKKGSTGDVKSTSLDKRRKYKPKKQEEKEEIAQEKKKKKAAKQVTEQITEFAEASSNLKQSGSYIKNLFGLPSVFDVFDNFVGSIKKDFGGIASFASNIFLSPIKSIGLGIKGIGKSLFGGSNLKRQEETEAKQEESIKESKQINTNLEKIVENTTPEKEMLKMKLPKFLEKLKGMIPDISAKGIGASAMKLVGGALILGGVAWFISDFISGFKEGGIKGGLSRMFLGKLDGSVSSAMKNAGKYALIGAGIGSIVPVVGTIAGGLIGGAVGLLLNTVGSLFKSKGSVGSKLKKFFLGEDKGISSALFQGSKYAAIGALAGSIFPVVGTIAGGMIGFAIGFLISLVKQYLPKDIKKGISKIYNKISEKVKEGWEWATKKFTELKSYISKNIGPWIDGFKKIMSISWGFVKKGFSLVGDLFTWIGDKLNIGENIKKIKDGVSEAWDKTTKLVSKFFNWVIDGVSEFFSNIWGGIKDFFSSDDKSKFKDTKEKDSQLVEKKGVISDINNNIEMHLKTISEFMQTTMIEKIETVFLKGLNNLATTMRGVAMEQRAFDYIKETGSAKGFLQQQSKYSSELKRLGTGGSYGTKEQLIDARNTVNNSSNTNFTVFNQPSRKLRDEAE